MEPFIRRSFLSKIHETFDLHPLCGLLGPRQVGKTTLAKQYVETYFKNDAVFFDLENSRDLDKLQDPMLTFSHISERLIVIDEIQRRPDLFPLLRVLVDQPDSKHLFLILGSASRELLKQSSETLAGRIGYIELPPFSLAETHDSFRLWMRGGFPLSYLASSEEKSFKWREDFIDTFLETDIPNLGFQIPASQLRRFWLMIVYYHGQTFNASAISRSMGISDHTVRRYLDILAGTFMVRILTPWHENLEKRQVKSPKIYFRDSGILHALSGIYEKNQLLNDPRLGAFWEGFALEEIIRTVDATSKECYFWGTIADAELDLLIIKRGVRVGFEFKYAYSPTISKSMRIAINDLKLDHLAVVYPGDEIYPLAEKITAYGLDTISSGLFQEKLYKVANLNIFPGES